MRVLLLVLCVPRANCFTPPFIPRWWAAADEGYCSTAVLPSSFFFFQPILEYVEKKKKDMEGT